MKRRVLLRGLAAAGTLTLTAGCLADDAPGNESTDTNDSTDSPTQGPKPTDTRSETSDGTPSKADDDTVSRTTHVPEPSETPGGVADHSLSVTGRSCGTRADEASISFDDGTDVVTVSGTIWGNDACYTATLSGTRYGGDTLTVVVAAESDPDADAMCAQCITEVDYEATVTLDGELPGRVEVVHRHGESSTTAAVADR